MNNIFGEDDLSCITEQRIVNNLSSPNITKIVDINSFLKDYGFQKILDITIPIKITRNIRKENSKLEIISNPIFEGKIDLDSKLRRYLIFPFRKNINFPLRKIYKKLGPGLSPFYRCITNVDDSYINFLVSGLNSKDREIGEDYARASLIAHEIGFNKSNTGDRFEGHLIHTLHPKKFDLNIWNIFVGLIFTHDLPIFKKLVRNFIISKRWHELRATIEEKDIIKRIGENDRSKKISSHIDDNSWNNRGLVGEEIREILIFLLEKTSFNLDLIRNILDSGKKQLFNLDIWLFCILADLANGIDPENLENDSSIYYFLKQIRGERSDYDTEKKFADNTLSLINKYEFTQQLTSMFELITIENNVIKRNWYSYKPRDYLTIKKSMKILLYLKNIIKIFKRRKVNAISNGFNKHPFINYNFQEMNINPFDLAMKGRVKPSSTIKYFKIGYNAYDYLKIFNDASIKTLKFLGCNNIKDYDSWINK